MQKLQFSDVTAEQVVDIRNQLAFQNGHLDGALNLIPRHFNQFLSTYVGDEAVVVVTDDADALDELDSNEQIRGYLLAEEIPAEVLVQLQTISAADLLQSDDEFVLLDVRRPEDITRPAPEKNLVSIPFAELPGRLAEIDQALPIYTLCGTGNSATAVASYLVKHGFRAKVVEGGMKAVQEEQSK
ncbi:rhodanese-like domain-containing protein [Fundicoccus sp. Sow4_H7]|uniref:rhodanese-like domain-containing protein n=1 Tax=Fundicoccus sp. Sow4_H7 TaxID=3438784 RepID=UPI003F90D0C1